MRPSSCVKRENLVRFSVSRRLPLTSPVSIPLTNKSPESLLAHYANLLRKCSATRSLAETREVHNQMKDSSFPYVSLGNKLIDAYLKCGSLIDARQMFDEMPRRHIVSWNSMISAYIRHKRSSEALCLYSMMLRERIFPDEFTFSSIFKAFSNLHFLRGGKISHGHMIVMGFDNINVFICTSLVDMYVKFGQMKEARLISDRALEKDVVLTTALIVGYTQKGEFNEAIEAFREMFHGGLKGNEFTFSSVLIACGNLGGIWKGKLVHGLIIKCGFESENSSWSSLLSMYSKCNLIDDAFKVFADIISPNLVTWTAFMAGMVHNGREEHAVVLFKRMIKESNVIPNEFTLSTILRACSSLAMFELGKQLHGWTIKIGLDRGEFTASALIDMYGKCGNTEMAWLLFNGLKEPDLVSVNSMINGYAQNSNGGKALDLFWRMQDFGIQPNSATYVSVLSACSNSGLLEEGWLIFSSITEDLKIEPSTDHYACMVSLLGRCGKIKEAEKLITKSSKPDVVLWRALLSVCRISGDVEIAEKAARKVFELEPGDEGTYVLLSNIYALKGLWEDVIKMKVRMRKMKLKKNPATSWVEVDREIHTFMAGDQSHPRWKEIYMELEKLMETIKGMGYVPDKSCVLLDLDETEKERSLYYHSEKLAVTFALFYDRKKDAIKIFKNLRVCEDCHTWMKLVSKAKDRDVIARDAKRFHHFSDGLCSCGDYW